jgi:flagellar basal body-associated protein FliL
VSANPPVAAPAKSKMMLIIIGVVVAVLVIGGGITAWLISSRSHVEDEEGGGPARKEAAKVAPTFLPMENMVVNLADPGGDRFAQIGITLELEDAKTADQVKMYLPSIRSGILMLVSHCCSAKARKSWPQTSCVRSRVLSGTLWPRSARALRRPSRTKTPTNALRAGAWSATRCAVSSSPVSSSSDPGEDPS